MNCKNCGARLRDNARVCPNCGAFVDDESGYTLLTSDDRLDDFYSDEPPIPKKKKSGTASFLLALVLTLAIAAGGAYYYFTHLAPKQNAAPPVSFSTGSGVINDSEPVVYAAIEKNAKIQYIHGVTLYRLDSAAEGGQAFVTADYEYTKNIDDTFRVIFFDVSELGLKENGGSFRFEIKLGFHGDDEVYTYTANARIDGAIKDNAADVVFDHSNARSGAEETDEKTTEKDTTKATTKKTASDAFVYDSYWFTEPYTDGDTRTIFALKFNRDNTFVSTRYEKKGDADWSVSTYNGTLKKEEGYLIATDGEGSESTYYKIGDEALTEEKDGETVQKLTARRYNSVKNAEDFFGI